jgi:hypothetical protein
MAGGVWLDDLGVEVRIVLRLFLSSFLFIRLSQSNFLASGGGVLRLTTFIISTSFSE